VRSLAHLVVFLSALACFVYGLNQQQRPLEVSMINLTNMLKEQLMVEYWMSCWEGYGGDDNNPLKTKSSEILCNTELKTVAEVLALYDEHNRCTGTFSHPDAYIRVFHWGREVFPMYSQSADGDDVLTLRVDDE
jgi:hypothetical protein